MKRIAALLAAGVVLGMSVGVHAAPVTYVTTLSGANENPANTTTGSGTATVIIDTAAHTLQVFVAFSGLGSPTVASHIHCCAAAPANAGVATATPSFPGFPLGVTGGNFNATFDLTQAGTWNAAFITANGGTPAGAEAKLASGLAAGQAYLNVHTVNFPAGEERGFLAPAGSTPIFASTIPTLSETAFGLLIGTLAAAGVVLLRRRRA